MFKNIKISYRKFIREQYEKIFGFHDDYYFEQRIKSIVFRSEDEALEYFKRNSKMYMKLMYRVRGGK